MVNIQTNRMWIVVIIAVYLFSVYCSDDNPTNPTQNITVIKSSSGYIASATYNISRKLYLSGITIPSNAVYEDGWWSFMSELPNGLSAQIQIQLKEQNGNIQKFYNPLTTYYILGKGITTGIQGSIDFNFTLIGVNVSSVFFVVYGNAQVNYQGTVANVEVKDLKISKQSNSYPSGGTIVIWIYGAKVTITFDGSRYAHGTFIYNNTTYEFTIDLETGQVS